MTRVEFKQMARAKGYVHIDLGQDCVFAYNSLGGCLAWFQDDVKLWKKPRKSTKKATK